jgi:peptidoglycan-associated lipoprotein
VNRTALVPVAAALLSLAGCAHRAAQAAAVAPPPPDAVVKADPEPKPPEAAPAPGDRWRQQDQGEAPCALRAVHFELASAELDGAAEEVLAEAAACIARRSLPAVLVEGHCDVRGSVALNDVLGQQRAEQVARRLSALGVTAQLTTVSFGKAFPLVRDAATEAQHAENRRAELRVPGDTRADGRRVPRSVGG